MSDSITSDFSAEDPAEISIAITPMHRTEEGIWETGPRQGAQFLLVELIQGEGEEAEVVVECRDERSAAFAARVAAATIGALGLNAESGSLRVEAFDDETAAILAEHETPEIAAASGEWREADDDEEEDDEDAKQPRQ